MADTASIKTEYFAAMNSDDLCSELMKKTDNYYKYLQESGRMSIWRRSYEAYYRNIFRGGKMNRAGNEGEYTTININHLRNLVQHLINMTTQQLPALIPQSANSDYRSMAETIVASGILDYYLNEKSMMSYADIAVEDCLIFGEAYVAVEWDTSEGEEYGANTDTGQIYKTGDIVFQNFTPMDVIVDFAQPDPFHHNWKITRQYKTKFDIAEKYPAHKDKIIQQHLDDSRLRDQRIGMMTLQQTDLIPIYTFYHKRTPAMPNGRLMIYLTSETWLFDGPLPYNDIPLYRVAAAEHRGTCFGFTLVFDLLPVQEGVDGLHSTIITNQSNYGVQNIAVPRGSGISVQQLAGGLNLIQYDPKQGKPEGLNLTNTPPEIFKYLEMLEMIMETLSGVNSVARGNPQASLKSGAALALVQSMAIQFNNGLQKAYAKLWSDLGTATINLLKRFPQTKRNIVISGKNNRSFIKEFQKDDLKNINRVTVDLGNPLTRTTAGKVNMADNLLERGLIKEPEQYLEVLQTGSIEPVYEGPRSEKMLIRSENENMMEGIAAQAVATDQHSLHIQEHKTVIASPESRQAPNIVQVVLSHIGEHINLLRNTDPGLLMSIGQQPMPPLPPPQPQPQQPPAPPPQGKGQPPGEIINPESPEATAVDKVHLPTMPKNPLTGNKFNPVTGGLQ
jgi:hypothetical protein